MNISTYIKVSSTLKKTELCANQLKDSIKLHLHILKKHLRIGNEIGNMRHPEWTGIWEKVIH